MIRSLLSRSSRSELWPAALLWGMAAVIVCGLGACNRSPSPDESGVPATAPAGPPLVEIKGGADETRHNYEWTVTNRHTSPITRIEFPHYHADAFVVPSGWSTEGTTFLVNVGVADKPGICVATVMPSHTGIPEGGRQEFRMRITASGALVGEGKVRIKFKDDSTTVVPGVVLPVPPPYDFKYLPLVGAALIFGLWVIIRTIRERRRRASQADGGQDAGN
jgi:hypothetical protein